MAANEAGKARYVALQNREFPITIGVYRVRDLCVAPRTVLVTDIASGENRLLI